MKNQYRKNSLSNIGLSICHRIPEKLKKTESLKYTFKHKMKHYYLNYLANPNYGILVDLIMCTFHFLSYSPTCYFFSSQSAITCSKLTIETLEQGVRHVQS